MSIGLLLADDHPVYRHGLKSLLQRDGFNVVGEAGDGYEALKLVERLRPDVVLLDYAMPILNGLDAAKEIVRNFERSKVVLLTAFREEQYVIEAFKAGVRGYVLKSDAIAALVVAIHEVFRGNAYVSPGIAGVTASSCLAKSKGVAIEQLSPRERQVVKLIAEGNTTREIAVSLNLAVKTAESYRAGLMNKLDIHDTASLVRYAVRCGLVTP